MPVVPIKYEIDAGRPLLLMVKLFPIDLVDSDDGGHHSISRHWMTVIGYREVVEGLDLPFVSSAWTGPATTRNFSEG